MASDDPYDLVVIGGGSGGLVAAVGAAMFGVKVALVDKREFLGGDCLNFGCVPSKALIRTARAAHELRRADRFGLPAIDVTADLAAVMGYVRGVVKQIGVNDDAERFRQMGIEVILGTAPQFLSPRKIRVGDRVLGTKAVVIATGSRPMMPDVPGLVAARPYDNESIFYDLDILPKRLLVLGGGPIGCELGQAFARLGSTVTVVQKADRLLPREEPDSSALLEKALTAEGIRIMTRTEAIAVHIEGAETVVRLEGQSLTGELRFDEILVATGRRPNVEGLELALAGVTLDPRGFIAVDAAMRTSARGIYAVGDVIGRFPFTHMAEAEAKVALRNVLFPFTGRMDYGVVPWSTFTHPEVARVGALEAELKAAGTPHRVFRFPFSHADRAITDAETTGFIQLLASPRGKILGATIVGAQAGEAIQEYVLAMKHGLTLGAIANTIHVYPTLTLANRRAADLFLRDKLNGLAGRVLKWIAKL